MRNIKNFSELNERTLVDQHDDLTAEQEATIKKRIADEINDVFTKSSNGPSWDPDTNKTHVILPEDVKLERTGWLLFADVVFQTGMWIDIDHMVAIKKALNCDDVSVDSRHLPNEQQRRRKTSSSIGLDLGNSNKWTKTFGVKFK